MCQELTAQILLISQRCPCPLRRSCMIYLFLNDGCVRDVVFHQGYEGHIFDKNATNVGKILSLKSVQVEYTQKALKLVKLGLYTYDVHFQLSTSFWKF